MPTRVPADLIDVAVEDVHALDVRLFEELAAVWQLTGAEQAAVLARTPMLHVQWVAGNIDPDTATAVGTRLGYLLAIDLSFVPLPPCSSAASRPQCDGSAMATRTLRAVCGTGRCCARPATSTPCCSRSKP